MIKRLIHFTTFLLAVISANAIAIAQSDYVMPRAFNLAPIVRRSFPSFYIRSYPGGPLQRLYTDGFYPIGWSRDGKFAYYSEPVDEECGCYFATLTIIDLRTDKLVWEFKNKPTERMNDKGEPIADDMRKLWKRNERMFFEKLREHKIEQQARFVMMPAAFRSGAKSYTAKVVRAVGDDPDGLNRIRKIDLSFSSPSLGKKFLYSAEYKGEEMYGSPLDAAVAGVFKSPFENRVAVVLIKVQRGWEGPPHTVKPQIAGADLVTGFKK